MKIPLLYLTVLVGCAALTFAQSDIPGLKTLAIGDPAPDFRLPGIDGKTHTLADYKSAAVFAVVFMSNHCPDSQAAEGRIKQLVSDFGSRGLALVAINPNNPDGLRDDELGYSKYNDSFPEMILHAQEQDFNFPYLNDGETQRTAKAYGCLATPHLFVFDAARKLRYKGELDNSRFADPATVTSTAGRDAVAALIAGQPITLAETKPHGCSTKWMEKSASVAQEIAQWEQVPVDVEPIDAAGVAALRQNGTDKFRLFNVWATWCAPCVDEFPELVKTARKFGMRKFEMITISLDAPQHLGKAKTFLERNNASIPTRIRPTVKAEGRTTNSYLYEGADQSALVAALDPEWPGPIPHTVLVAPNGEIIWRHNGMVDGEELRETILAAMGRFYLPK